MNRQKVDEIRVIGRATQGVRLVNLDEGDVVMDVARLVHEDEDEMDESVLGDTDTESEVPEVVGEGGGGTES